MKEFIEELIDRLEEYRNFEDHDNLDRQCIDGTIEIVNQLAEEYNQFGNSEQVSGWIPVTERLPQESEPVDTLCEIVNVMLKNGIVTSGWCNRYLEKWYVLDHHHDYPLPCEYKDVIAWQPLPAPYGVEKSEWKDKVMQHFTKIE